MSLEKDITVIKELAEADLFKPAAPSQMKNRPQRAPKYLVFAGNYYYEMFPTAEKAIDFAKNYEEREADTQHRYPPNRLARYPWKNNMRVFKVSPDDTTGKNISQVYGGPHTIEPSTISDAAVAFWNVNDGVFEADLFKPAKPEDIKGRPEPADRKTFKVAAVSSNTNSFGLHNVVMVAKDGEAWSVAASPYNLPRKGMTYIPHSTGSGQWGWAAGWGFEIPHRLHPDAPPEVVREVWGQV